MIGTRLFIAVTLAAVSAGAVVAEAATTTRPAYGCFKVSASSTPIRDKGSKDGSPVATAYKGETLVKSKRFCGIRGYCAVSHNGVSGYVDKTTVKVAPCPASTSKPVN